jgi:tetratricopeptide (TPR) repeat protein
VEEPVKYEEVLGKVEALYHYFKAGQYKQAAPFRLAKYFLRWGLHDLHLEMWEQVRNYLMGKDLADCYYYLGRIYKARREYLKALKFFLKSKRILNQILLTLCSTTLLALMLRIFTFIANPVIVGIELIVGFIIFPFFDITKISEKSWFVRRGMTCTLIAFTILFGGSNAPPIFKHLFIGPTWERRFSQESEETLPRYLELLKEEIHGRDKELKEKVEREEEKSLVDHFVFFTKPPYPRDRIPKEISVKSSLNNTKIGLYILDVYNEKDVALASKIDKIGKKL